MPRDSHPYCQGLEEENGTGFQLQEVEEKLEVEEEEEEEEVVEEDVRVAPPPPPVPRCLRHREELKLYCEEDQELVCLVCGISQEHRSHNLLCVQEAEQRYKVSSAVRLKGLVWSHFHTTQALQHSRESSWFCVECY